MPARTQPTRDEWKQIEEVTTQLYSRVRLSIDGYDVVLQLGQISKNRLAICIWVNGAFKSEWCEPGHEVARRFYRIQKRKLFSPKVIASFEKACGKKAARAHGFHDTFESVCGYWPSFARLKAHLIKNNDSIVWLTEGAKEAQAA